MSYWVSYILLYFLSYFLSAFNRISSPFFSFSAPCPPVLWPSMWHAPLTMAWRWGPSWPRTTRCALSLSAWSTAATPAAVVQLSTTTTTPVWPVWTMATTPPVPPPMEHMVQPDPTGPPRVSALSSGQTSSISQTAAVTRSRGQYRTRFLCPHRSELSGTSWRERRWARGNRSFRSWKMSFTDWWTPGRWLKTWGCLFPRYVKTYNIINTMNVRCNEKKLYYRLIIHSGRQPLRLSGWKKLDERGQNSNTYLF